MDVSAEDVLKMSDDEVDQIIRQYFRQEEWENLAHLERLKHRLMYVNYVSNPELARLKLLPIPLFLPQKNQQSSVEPINEKKTTKRAKKISAEKKPKKAKIQTSVLNTTSRKNPDRAAKTVLLNYFEDEVPEDERYISRLKLLPIPLFLLQKNQQSSVTTTINEKKTTKRAKQISAEKKPKKAKIKKSALNTTSRKNPDRAAKTVLLNYIEDEVPEDDRYIFCDTCQKEVLDYCPTCGMLTMLNDANVPVGEPDRARKTVPSVFEVRESSVHGLGVFALRKVPLGIQMGPYQGTVSRVANTNGYSWKLRNGKLVDAADETVSNWMRYVNCSSHSSAQNVMAFQYKGELFYRTVKAIEQGDELLVYYGNSFARELGIEPKKYFDPECEETVRTFFLCKYCHCGLSMEKYKKLHEAYCSLRLKPRYFKGDAFACLHCQLLHTREEDRNNHEKRCKKRLKAKRSPDNCVGTDAAIFVCDYERNFCSLQTEWDQSLKNHLNNHNGFGLICVICLKTFKRKILLDSHYVNQHQDKSEIWKEIITYKINKCSKCSYQSVNTTKFKYHLKTHQIGQEKFNFRCNICGYQCIQKGHLTRHVRLHTGKVPFACIECNKKFNRKQELDAHIISGHSYNAKLVKSVTNKVHSCKKCSYRTVVISSLKRHLKSCT